MVSLTRTRTHIVQYRISNGKLRMRRCGWGACQTMDNIAPQPTEQLLVVTLRYRRHTAERLFEN